MKCSAKEVNIPLKRFENKRCVLLAVLVFLGLLVVAASTILVMIFLGWRFTYQPELDNKWDAISAVAAWAGVVVAVASTTASFLAVWFAIRVPQKIADRQNRIALFEKRLSCFEMIGRLRQIYYLIKDETDIETIKKDVVLVYSQNYSRDFNATNFPVLIGELMDQCSQMSFLFDCVEYEEANNLGLAFGKFLSVLYNADDKMLMPAKAAYLKAIDNFVTAHIEEISSCLFISNS